MVCRYQYRRERGLGGRQPPTFSRRKKIFSTENRKNIKFLNANNIWDFSLFIKQGISDKK